MKFSSVAGTSLRRKDCQKIINQVAQAFPRYLMTDPIYRQVRLLLTALGGLINEKNSATLASFLTAQAMPLLKETFTILYEWHSDTRGSLAMRADPNIRPTKDLERVLGKFYLEETEKQERDKPGAEENLKILSMYKELLIESLGICHAQRLFEHFLYDAHRFKELIPDLRLSPTTTLNSGQLETMLRTFLESWCRTIHQSPSSITPTSPPQHIESPYRSQDSLNFSKTDLVDNMMFSETGFATVLQKRILLDNLNQLPVLDSRISAKPGSFRRINSDEEFKLLMSDHVERLLNKILYFSVGGSNVHNHVHNNVDVICPRTLVFNDRKEFYFRVIRNNGKYELPNDLKIQLGLIRDEFLHKYAEQTSPQNIIKHSSQFRGRIRWSILYIEHMFAVHLQKVTELDHNLPVQVSGPYELAMRPLPAENEFAEFREDLVNHATWHIAEFIKSCLKGRIRYLKRHNRHLLLRDLYFTAIRANLMHKPCIFPTDTSAQMVAEGFALLEPSKRGGALEQQLCEPLVVDAVIEYLQENDDDEDRLAKVLENLLIDNQNDASAFGKAAEFYFAWVCSVAI
jgi:hypothetical protein